MCIYNDCARNDLLTEDAWIKLSAHIRTGTIMGRDLVIGCYKYTNIPNSTWGVAIGKKRAETTILRHSMPK